MSETVFVIFMIMIVIGIGIIMYTRFQAANIGDSERAARNKLIVGTAHQLSTWSELDCSVAESIEVSCFDKSKIEVFSNFISQSIGSDPYAFEYYFDLLRNSKITIKEVFPDSSKEWVLYNNEGKTKQSLPVYIPVSLYDPIERTYDLGMMEILVYE